MSDIQDIENLISGSLLRLRVRAPFFATLTLFAQIVPTGEVETAATDGRRVFVNPAYLRTLTSAQVDQLLLHKVLHAALLHVSRRGTRDQQLWNIAGDIVVNGMISQIEGFQLMEGQIRNQELEEFSVEEVYELLQKQPVLPHLNDPDLLDAPLEQTSETAPGGSEDDGAIAARRNSALDAYWRHAHQHANMVVFGIAQGRLPARMARELGMLNPARLDWRAHLWRYIAQTPTDFQGFDRRFVGRGLYLDMLESDSLKVYVAVDTSGSIDRQTIRALVSEVQGILRAYPHVRCDLYYADSEAYGPYPLTERSDEMPPPTGDGGTDFRPFFRAVGAARSPHESCVCIYLTDGYGDFPEQAPDVPVLWVVTPGGRALEVFPFGETVRLVG